MKLSSEVEILTLNPVTIRKGFNEKVSLNQDLKEMREQVIWMSGERVIQAEKPTNAKYLRQECAWNVPEKSGWPVYLQQNEREGED